MEGKKGEEVECDQLCVNTDGSYRCVCGEGYALAADGQTCLGRMINNKKIIVK